MSPAEAPVVHGIALPHYVAVRAAQAEGFPAAEVLEMEGIEPYRWAQSDRAWKLRLVDDRAIFTAYEIEYAAGEDWLDREVSPLRDDVVSWAAFLSAFAAKGGALLLEHALRLSDLNRLRRRWARRLEQDPSLDERIAEHRRKSTALPAIEVAPAALRPSRYARGCAARAVRIASLTGIGVEPALTLYQYAALCAEIAERPADSTGTLRRYSLSDEGALSELDGLWRGEMDRDPLLAADFRRLFAHNRARLSASCDSSRTQDPPRDMPGVAAPVPQIFHGAPPAIRAALRGTALVLDLPRGPALPFVVPVADDPRNTINVQKPSSATTLPRESLTGTALALDVPKGPVLPFAQSAGVSAIAVPGRPTLVEAFAIVDVGRGLPVPFHAVGAAVPAEESVSPPPCIQDSAPRTGTALALDIPRADALPFTEAGGTKPAPTSAVVDLAAMGVAEERPGVLGVTAPLSHAPATAALLFASGSRKVNAEAAMQSSSKPQFGKLVQSFDVRAALRVAQTRFVSAPAAPVLPVNPAEALPMTRAPAPVAPPFTVEQYASLCVDLWINPAEEAKTLARYRITPAERAAIDSHFAERMGSDPGLRQAWDGACRTYRAWLLGAGRRGP